MGVICPRDQTNEVASPLLQYYLDYMPSRSRLVKGFLINPVTYMSQINQTEKQHSRFLKVNKIFLMLFKFKFIDNWRIRFIKIVTT